MALARRAGHGGEQLSRQQLAQVTAVEVQRVLAAAVLELKKEALFNRADRLVPVISVLPPSERHFSVYDRYLRCRFLLCVDGNRVKNDVAWCTDNTGPRHPTTYQH